MMTNEKRMSSSQARTTARRYLSKLLRMQRAEATSEIIDLVESGVSVKNVYLHVLQPTMYEVGRLWQTNEIDIAVEHYITAATQMTMAQLLPHSLKRKRIGKKVVCGCLGSELHQLGLRMVSDFFEYEGWDTYFMGAIVPDLIFLDTVKSHEPDVVCISLTMQSGVPQAKELIEKIHHEMDPAPVILVGGLALIMNPALTQIVGADGMGESAKDTVELAARLVSGRNRQNPNAGTPQNV